MLDFNYVYYDEQGFVSLLDALFAIFLLMMILLASNYVLNIEIPSISEENNDFKTGQDIMELMSSKIDGRDYSTIERVSYILDSKNNSISSQRDASLILDEFFEKYFDENTRFSYTFVEEIQLNGKVLSANGNLDSANKVSVAIRNFRNYSYKLYIY